MVFAVVVLALALALGVVSGGRLAHLAQLDLRYGGLVAAAVAVQLLGAVAGGPAYPVGLAVSACLAGWFLVLNRGVRGTGLVALGLLCNALVVGLNGAMPVSSAALGHAGVSTQSLLDGSDPRHELAGGSTRLEPLGDVIPVLLPWHAEVVSPGDVLVAAGLGQLVLLAVRRRARGRPAAPRPGCGTLEAHVSTRGAPPWPSEAASAARARRTPPTTASVPTPDRP